MTEAKRAKVNVAGKTLPNRIYGAQGVSDYINAEVSEYKGRHLALLDQQDGTENFEGRVVVPTVTGHVLVLCDFTELRAAGGQYLGTLAQPVLLKSMPTVHAEILRDKPDGKEPAGG